MVMEAGDVKYGLEVAEGLVESGEFCSGLGEEELDEVGKEGGQQFFEEGVVVDVGRAAILFGDGMARLRSASPHVLANVGKEQQARQLIPLLNGVGGPLDSLPSQIAELTQAHQRLQKLLRLQPDIAGVSTELQDLTLCKLLLLKLACAAAASLGSQSRVECPPIRRQ
jgi:hypothetical protein